MSRFIYEMRPVLYAVLACYAFALSGKIEMKSVSTVASLSGATLLYCFGLVTYWRLKYRGYLQ